MRDISIRLELDPALSPARGDRVQLQQVLLNLALNGMDAMQELRTGERILVFRTARDRPGAIRVAVRESGVGIGGRDVEHMFQAFHTTKAGGMGVVRSWTMTRPCGRVWRGSSGPPGLGGAGMGQSDPFPPRETATIVRAGRQAFN